MATANKGVKVRTEQGDVGAVTLDVAPTEDVIPTDGPLAGPVPAEEQQQKAADPEPETDPEEVAGWINAKRGHTFVTYMGQANVVEHVDSESGKSYRLEPGVPVEMPKAVAEVLLTTPFEEFVDAPRRPAPPVEEE